MLHNLLFQKTPQQKHKKGQPTETAPPKKVTAKQRTRARKRVDDWLESRKRHFNSDVVSDESDIENEPDGKRRQKKKICILRQDLDNLLADPAHAEDSDVEEIRYTVLYTIRYKFVGTICATNSSSNCIQYNNKLIIIALYIIASWSIRLAN